MFLLLRVEVEHSVHPPVLVGGDFAHVGIRPDFAVAGLFGHGNHGGERARFGTPLTPEGFTETAVCTCRPALVGLRQNRKRRRIGMPSQLACTPFQQDSGRLNGQRRQRIRLRARRVEGIGSRQTGNSHFPLRLGVVRFEVGIGDRPIGQTRAFDRSPAAALGKVDLVKTPVVPGELNRATSDTLPVLHECS